MQKQSVAELAQGWFKTWAQAEGAPTDKASIAFTEENCKIEEKLIRRRASNIDDLIGKLRVLEAELVEWEHQEDDLQRLALSTIADAVRLLRQFPRSVRKTVV